MQDLLQKVRRILTVYRPSENQSSITGPWIT